MTNTTTAALRSATRLSHVLPGYTQVRLPQLRLSSSGKSFSTVTPAICQENLSSDQLTQLETIAQGRPIDPRTQEPRKGSNWNYEIEMYSLAHRIGHSPKDIPSLKIALTHHSALNVDPLLERSGSSRFQHNGRLAVLGQYTISCYVGESLFYRYPNMEGNLLLDLEAHLTSTENLAKLADYLGVVDLIRTQYELNDPSKAYILARAFQAVVGALYTDVGPNAARRIVHDFVLSQLAGQDMHEFIKFQHPKSMLASILKGQGQALPTTRLLRESGRLTHFPSFVVGVYSGERLLAEGCGTSLKRAEKEAVTTALFKHLHLEMAQGPLPSDHEDSWGQYHET